MTADEMFKVLGYALKEGYKSGENFNFVYENRYGDRITVGGHVCSKRLGPYGVRLAFFESDEIRAVNKLLDEMEKDNWMPFTGGESDGKR